MVTCFNEINGNYVCGARSRNITFKTINNNVSVLKQATEHNFSYLKVVPMKTVKSVE